MSKKHDQPINPNEQDPNLELAYTDKAGNKYFGFVDPEIAPKVRTTYCERAARYAEMYISETNFKKAAVSMREAYNKGDFAKLGSIVEEIEFSSHFLGEEESLLEIAAGFFIMNNEDPYEIHQKIVSQKIDIWSTDGKAKDFFLRKGMKLTTSYSQKSPEDVLSFFDTPQYQKRKARLNRLIS